MKHFLLLCLALFMLASQAKAFSFSAARGAGEDAVGDRGNLATHKVASEFPFEGEWLYNVAVNGHYVGLYNDRNFWGGLVHFGSFEFTNGHEVSIDISYYQNIDHFEVLPIESLSLLEVKRTGKRSLRIRTDRADQNITLVVNGELQKHVLHLFCNSIDTRAPEMEAAQKGYTKDEARKLHYFGPGYHNLETLLGTGDDQLKLEDGWQVYVAAGSVVYGRIGMWETGGGTSIRGRGMVYNDRRKPRVILEANYCKGGLVEGVLFHCHRERCWQVALSHCTHMEFKHVKVLSTRYASTDGLDIINCQQCAFLNTFVRASDDAIAVKGLGNKKPEECAPCRNLTFCGMQLWNDCNNAMGIGAENHASLYENIRFMNSSILYSYDDPDYHEVLDERAAMGICCINGTWFRNISYENIDVYHCERLITAGFQPSFWFGALPGDQSTPGGMEGIIYRNIRSFHSSGSAIANKIRLYGWDGRGGTPEKAISRVIFDNVVIAGQKVTHVNDPAFSETDFTRVSVITFQ